MPKIQPGKAFIVCVQLMLGVTGAEASTIGTGFVEPLATPPNTVVIPSYSGLTANTPAGTKRRAFGNFDIEFNFNGTPARELVFATLVGGFFWQNNIWGYETRDIANLVGGPVTIDVSFNAIDGPRGILGRAGATDAIMDFGLPDRDNFMVPTAGQMEFDTADYTPGNWPDLVDVVTHEIGHILGFSSDFWAHVAAVSGVATEAPDGTFSGDDSYTGPIALATYQNEFDPSAMFIPIEEAGGRGTAFAHWDESLFARWEELNGNDDNPYLMTGTADLPFRMSDTTLATFDDLGYVTVVTGVVPLPAPHLLLVSAFLGLGFLRRRIGG